MEKKKEIERRKMKTNFGCLLAKAFEKIPEWSIKNDIRYFLAFNKFIPKFISDLSPVKGYELYRKLKPKDIVVDVGAYPGDYAVFASRKIGKKGKIICFEPDPYNRKILKKNLELENLNNFIIIPKGLWNKNTNLKLENEGFRSSLSEKDNGGIEVTKLDDELKKIKIEKIDVLKMDVEGAEIEAIKGCKNILLKNSVYVMVASYHTRNNKKTFIFLEKYLSKLGYNVKTDFPKHLTTYAWKDSSKKVVNLRRLS